MRNSNQAACRALLLAWPVLGMGCAAVQPAPSTPDAAAKPEHAAHAFLGVRSVILHVDDLDAATQWYARVLEAEPYYHEAWYTGFSVHGFELGLDPDQSHVAPPGSGAVAYWLVQSVESAFQRLVELGAAPVSGLQEVGGDIRLAILRDPFGNLLGIIEDPGSPLHLR